MSRFHPSITPEALLGRNDSKNPDTTCKGITTSGRPCRRALAVDSGRILKGGAGGVAALSSKGNADFYCWQHKDQARAQLPAQAPILPLKQRTSIDTLMERLNIEERSNAKPSNPPMVEEDPRQSPLSSRRKEQRKKKPSFWASLCCITEHSDDDYLEIVRHEHRVQQQRPGNGARPSNNQKILSLIPPNLSITTTSSILNELVKPFPANDEEGYIYIFWLTPQSQPAPGDETSRSLLSPAKGAGPRERRISDVLSEFSTSSTRGKPSHSIKLKIGRANNVTRRMNEWERQCGYTLNLVRWYPYYASTAGLQVGKVRHVKRVERLVHLELAEKRVLTTCDACGKEHREWFEVEASKRGVKEVDECVRRWVSWAEQA
ncbi:DUF1766-domain-containing protein [Piedraia hortae CBS 480.64]|uniref:DUF1766-domain-containing protein n=1 Tax=Piedraia hortae CBS 480.64 TaxID=1314780 RepID=A0A6A7C4H2_9PEZI|nr:DUF1766-domain-containing protein [Piedraia hortae CBS 480.64]